MPSHILGRQSAIVATCCSLKITGLILDPPNSIKGTYFWAELNSTDTILFLFRWWRRDVAGTCWDRNLELRIRTSGPYILVPRLLRAEDVFSLTLPCRLPARYLVVVTFIRMKKTWRYGVSYLLDTLHKILFENDKSTTCSRNTRIALRNWYR